MNSQNTESHAASAVAKNTVEILSHAPFAPARKKASRGRIALGAIFTLAGTLHLLKPEPYLRIMPPYLPAHAQLVALSGLAEIGLGLALLTARFRRPAAWGLVALLIAVFPANLYMYQLGGATFGLPDWVLLARLPLQLLLIRWAYLYTRRYPSAPAC